MSALWSLEHLVLSALPISSMYLVTWKCKWCFFYFYYYYYSNSILIQKCLFPPTYNILHAVNKVLYSIDSDIDYHDNNWELSSHSCTFAVETVSVWLHNVEETPFIDPVWNRSETRAPRGNPCRHGENMRSTEKDILAQAGTRTTNLLWRQTLMLAWVNLIWKFKIV